MLKKYYNYFLHIISLQSNFPCRCLGSKLRADAHPPADWTYGREGGKKKRSLCICMHLWEQFPPLRPVRAQVAWTEMYQNHVARELLELGDLLKCAAAANGNNTHGKETAQRITSIFGQHD